MLNDEIIFDCCFGLCCLEIDCALHGNEKGVKYVMFAVFKLRFRVHSISTVSQNLILKQLPKMSDVRHSKISGVKLPFLEFP